MINSIHQASYKNVGGTQDRIPPFAVPVAASDVLHRNYEALVSRVCKAESAVHTLRLNMMRVQGQHDLAQREKSMVNEKLATATDAFDMEIKVGIFKNLTCMFHAL